MSEKRMSYGDGKKFNMTPSRVASMALHMPVSDIAERLGITCIQVEEILEVAGVKTTAPVVIMCNRTNRRWMCRGWRSAYLRSCVLGLTDWEWRPALPGETV